MAPVLPDLRLALRQMASRPGFTAAAVLTLALGIGASTAMFSVVDAVLLEPLPYEDSRRLVLVWNSLTESGEVALSEPEVFDYREGVRSFDRLAAYRPAEVNLTGDAGAERVSAARASADVFPVLGRAPILGRTFAAEEDRPDRDDVAVLGYGLWKRRFGGDPAAVGRRIEVDGVARTVLGVMPEGFKLPMDFGSDRPTELWLPLALDPENTGGRGRHFLRAVARLAPGATVAQANAELEGITRRWVEEGVVRDERFSAYVVPVHEAVVGEVRPALLVLFAAVGLVLLIACANVAGLLLARVEERHREVAVRAALGAGPLRIARQLATESLVLAALGGAAGVLLAAWGLEAVSALSPATVPRLDELSIDGRVLAFTALAALTAAGLFGLLPALAAMRRDLVAPLKEGGRGGTSGRRQRARRALVVGQVALAVVLVTGAGLLLRSFFEMRQVELGFDPEGVLTLQLTLPPSEYPESHQVVGFYRELRERVEALPGVRTAGATALLPLGQPTGDWGIDIEGRTRGPGESFQGYLQVVTPGYFETLGMRRVRGRLVEEADGAEAMPAVVINERMAARYWAGEDALGERIRIRSDREGPWFTVVGVVGDIRHNAIVEEPRHEMYFPHAQLPLAIGGTTAAMNLVVRTESDPLPAAAPVRAAVHALDPDLPVAQVRSMRQVVDAALAEPRFTMLLIAVFAGMALLLGAVGIYGVIAYAVSQRTHELGVRMALGARAGQVLGREIRSGMLLVGVGIAFGTVAASLVTHVLESQLYGIGASDPVSFLLALGTLAAVGLAATYLPARRATRVDPIVALRPE